jgi:hypothetical protein
MREWAGSLRSFLDPTVSHLLLLVGLI